MKHNMKNPNYTFDTKCYFDFCVYDYYGYDGAPVWCPVHPCVIKI